LEVWKTQKFGGSDEGGNTRDEVARAMWVCTDENMGMCRDSEPWARVWGCCYIL